MAGPNDVAFSGEKRTIESAEEGVLHRRGLPWLGVWGQANMHT